MKNFLGLLRNLKIIIFTLFCFLFLFNLKAETNYLFYGKKALAEKNYTLALELLNKELNSNPVNCEAHFYKALTLERINQKEQATSSFLAVTKMNCSPKLKEQSFWKVFNYYKFLEDWDNLYEVSKAFLQFKPNSEVEKYYKIAEQNRDPNTSKLKELLVKAERHEKNENWTQAIELYKEIFSQTRDVQYLLKIALIYKNLKRDKEAYEIFLEILKYNPNHWYANYQLGIYSFSFGYPEECIQYLSKAEQYNQQKETNFIYYLNLTKSFCNLNLERYLDFKENVLFLKNLKYKKEENFYLLELFYNFFINHDHTINHKQIKISKNLEGFYVLQMLESFYQKDMQQLLNLLISLDLSNAKYVRWSNYMKQFFLILLVRFRWDVEKRTLLLNLLKKENFLEITKKPCGTSQILYFLQNYPQEPFNTLDKKFLEFFWFLENHLFPFTLVYLYYLQQEKEVFVELVHDLPNLENAFYYYLKSLSKFYQGDIQNAYYNLKRSINFDLDFKDIAREDPIIKELRKQNYEIDELLK